MENLKVKASSEAESKEAQELFFELGYKWLGGQGCSYLKLHNNFKYITAYFHGKSLAQGENGDAEKEITIPELRDMVVLNRNNVGDANSFRHDNGVKYYITSDNKYYYFSNILTFQWTESCNDIDYLEKRVKPIEKPMKEWLNKETHEFVRSSSNLNDMWIEIPEWAVAYADHKNGYGFFYDSLGKVAAFHDIVWQRNQEPKQAEFLVKTDNGYVLQVLDESAGGEDVVRIPDGAEIAILASGVVYFWKSHFFNGGVHKDWVDMKGGWDASWYLKSVPSAITIWKRETLNDQVASAEEYREMISNAAIAQYDDGGYRNASSQGQSEFPLNNYELNHRVAKAFNAVRGTDLNEDDVNYIRELINLTISHYGERK